MKSLKVLIFTILATLAFAGSLQAQERLICQVTLQPQFSAMTEKQLLEDPGFAALVVAMKQNAGVAGQYGTNQFNYVKRGDQFYIYALGGNAIAKK